MPHQAAQQPAEKIAEKYHYRQDYYAWQNAQKMLPKVGHRITDSITDCT
jgi:hypothetical protein